MVGVFLFKQKTAYEMRISDWSSDVCSSDLGSLDLLLVPCGGGGLLSGSVLAATTAPGCRVVGVEPETADDATRSFRSGTLHRVSNPPTIAEIGRASCREKCVSTCRSRWSPDH